MQPSFPSFSLSPGRGLLLHLVAFMLTVLPLWQTTAPPLSDYLNHLARMHILHDFDHSAALQQNYRVVWQIVPYYAMEAVVLPLLRVTDIYTAGKIFIVLGLLLTVCGVLWLHLLTFRRIHAPSFLVHPLLYSLNLGWGFVPFVFSIGVMLCLFAGLIALRERSTAIRLLYVTCAATLLFFCHLIALGIFALLVACASTAQDKWFSRSFFRHGLVMLPAFLPAVLLWFQVPQPPALDPHVIRGWLNPTLIMGLVFDGQVALALLVTLVLALVLGGAALGGILSCTSPVIRRSLLVTALVAVCLPERAFDIGLVNLRLPYVFSLLLPAGIGLQATPTVSRTKIGMGLGILGALFLMRQLSIAEGLAHCDAKTAEFRQAVRVLPRGTTLTALFNEKAVDPCGHWHWPTYINALAVIERDVFTPNLFMKMFALWPAPSLDDPGYGVAQTARSYMFFKDSPQYMTQPQKMREWRQNFRYLANIHFNTGVRVVPGTREIYRGSYFSLLEVVPETTPARP
jgi:hypothetical protein